MDVVLNFSSDEVLTPEDLNNLTEDNVLLTGMISGVFPAIQLKNGQELGISSDAYSEAIQFVNGRLYGAVILHDAYLEDMETSMSLGLDLDPAIKYGPDEWDVSMISKLYSGEVFLGLPDATNEQVDSYEEPFKVYDVCKDWESPAKLSINSVHILDGSREFGF